MMLEDIMNANNVYYGLRCYDKDSQPLGWLYTYESDTELVWTDKNLGWCKRWKTERGAKNNIDRYNPRWQFKSKGGYLRVELMPEMSKPESPDKSPQQIWNEQHPEVIEKARAEYDKKRPVWSARLTPEIVEWLEEERWQDESGKPESDTALLNRKLEKLRKLEQQGF